jgi:hypothetical protein
MNTKLLQHRVQMQVLILCAALLCLLPVNTVQAQSGNNVLSQILSGLQPLIQPGQPQPVTQPMANSGSCQARYEAVVTNVDGNANNTVIRFGEFQSHGRGLRTDRATARAKQNAEQCMQSHWQTRVNNTAPYQCQDQQQVTGYHVNNLKQTMEQEVCQGVNLVACNRGTAQVHYSLFATTDGATGCGVGRSSVARTLLASGLTSICQCRTNRGENNWGYGGGRDRDRDRRPRRQLQAPQQVSPAQGTTFYHVPRTTLVSWQPVRRGASYLVEVKYNGRLWTSLTTQGDATFATFDFPGAGKGAWRVTAQNRRGKQGTPSPWYRFSYQR